jgi:hypothetical protein
MMKKFQITNHKTLTEIPNLKYQDPNKSQASNLKTQSFKIGFGFFWFLELGSCDFYSVLGAFNRRDKDNND